MPTFVKNTTYPWTFRLAGMKISHDFPAFVEWLEKPETRKTKSRVSKKPRQFRWQRQGIRTIQKDTGRSSQQIDVKEIPLYLQDTYSVQIFPVYAAYKHF